MNDKFKTKFFKYSVKKHVRPIQVKLDFRIKKSNGNECVELPAKEFQMYFLFELKIYSM